MTAKQKAAREKFKKVVAEAGKLRKKNPKLTQAQAVKQAWAIHKKLGAIKIIEKGESKSAKPKATYQQVRTKKGTYKGLKKVGAIKKKAAPKKAAPKKSLEVSKMSKKQLQNALTKKLSDSGISKDFLKNNFIFEKLGSIKKKTASSKVKARKRKSTEMHTDTKSHNVNIRVVSGLPSYKDPDMARELELYADNDSLLYFQRRKPILINLSKKYKKGTFDVQKAAKLWRYYIDAALEKYNKEFGSRGDKWYDLMSVADRNLLALEYAQNTKEEFDLGNFTEK